MKLNHTIPLSPHLSLSLSFSPPDVKPSLLADNVATDTVYRIFFYISEIQYHYALTDAHIFNVT